MSAWPRNAGFASILLYCSTLGAFGFSDVVECPARGGFVVQGEIYPYALVSHVRDCDDNVTLRFKESIGHEPSGKPVEILRDEITVQLQPDHYVFGCQVRGEFTGVVAVTHHGADWRRPHIYRAWRADFDSWTFEEIFEGPAECSTPAPINCD